jgi:hypothetical protein
MIFPGQFVSGDLFLFLKMGSNVKRISIDPLDLMEEVFIYFNYLKEY